MLPGLGPAATIAMLLPITFGLEPVSSLIMLAGIFYGAQYGGSTTAILVNLPGESSSVITALDGHAMAKRGQAGKALATAALGSFFAGTVTTLLIALFSPPLAEMALKFGPAEYFSLMVLGLVASVVLANGSLLHAFGMITLGLLLGMIGTDVNSGVARFSFDVPELTDGISFVVVAMGVFGIGEIIGNLQNEADRNVMVKKVTGLMLDKEDFKAIAAPVVRGTMLGSILGVLPGGGAMLSSFAAYALAKKISKNAANFGKGATEGVAAPIFRGTAIGSALGILPGGGAILAAFASYTVEKRLSDKVSMCNFWANRLVCEAADRAMQVHGGIGYSRHKPFEHIYRHHRRYRITEGSEEIQMRKIAGHLFGYMGANKH